MTPACRLCRAPRTLLCCLSAVLCVLFFAASLGAAIPGTGENVTQTAKIDPHDAMAWATIPAGGHFYLGDYGAAYPILLGSIGLGGLSLWNQYKIWESNSPEYNYFFFLFGEVYTLQSYDAYREARLRRPDLDYRHPIDPTPVPQLLLAPYKWENLTSPYVWGVALLSGAYLWAVYSISPVTQHCNSLSTVTMFGHDFGQGDGTAVYETSWTLLNTTVAASEESFFRGYFQTEMEEDYGPLAGLAIASVTFGGMHYFNIYFNGETEAQAWGDVAFATMFGFYSGWLFQDQGYKLSKCVAAHFWWNEIAGAVGFLVDPTNNPLKLKVSFNY